MQCYYHKVTNALNKEASGYAIQHDSVPVASQDKLGGLRQEGRPAVKNGGVWAWGRH